MKVAAIFTFLVALTVAVGAQAPQTPAGRGGRAGGPPPTPRAAAPIDLTGNWVAVISEDWRWRMVTPAKGDVQSIPVTQKALDVANAWDPARDTAAGEQCRAYGAPGLMRSPTRLRISWKDDQTLQVETDYGMQTRLLYFAPSTPPAAPPSWQGSSVARWDGLTAAGRGFGGPVVRVAPGPSGSLRVVTTNLRPGYLRKNGVPYSANTTLTEHWNLFQTPTNTYVVITTLVRDPEHLQIDWLTSLNFQREADGSKWDPKPCNATW